MDIDNLVTMANQIGEFFSVYSDRAEGEREIADHLKKFWEPRMRIALLTHLDARDGAGLDAIVRDAIQGHRQELMPRAAP
jgi:formate dehydrogenase subunit delta